MLSDETMLNPQPSEETEANGAQSLATPNPEVTQADSVSTFFKTETVSAGPLTEEIRVVELKDLAVLEEQSRKSAVEQSQLYQKELKDIAKDQRILGTVVAVGENEIMVDVGFKSEGIVSYDEFGEGELPKIGDQIEVLVETLEDENGQMILSKRKADFMRVWERIRELYNSNQLVEGKITGRIKGGMVVDVMGIDAFLPGSQIDIRPVTDFDSYVGKTFDFRIVKLNELRKNIVLSRKELLEEAMRGKREELLSRIKVGEELTGRVKNITDFGAFIDLGGLDGLLHITDMSWGRINHPKEIVQIDQEIKVKVIDYDPEKQRVSLGLKQLSPHPWEGIEQKYPVDSVVEGKVVNIANYGVFVELEKGVEGLIHISEISWTQHIKHPSEVFQIGDIIKAKVLGIDSAERKISLGYKQLEPDPWDNIEQNFQVGGIYKGIVRNLTSYGAFVELQEGIDGFVHVSDMSWKKKLHHPREVLRKDQEIVVKILDISKENRKITLGIKQTEEDPWPMIEALFTVGSIVEGEVQKIADKFIVVNLDHEMEGIVPLGQMPKKDRKDLSKAVKVGDRLQLKVLEVNRHEKKIVLSREQAMPKEPKTEVEAFIMQQAQPTDKIEIPTEILAKIVQSEEPSPEVQAQPVAAPEKPKSRRKKTETTETAETVETEATEPAPEEGKTAKKKKVTSQKEQDTESAEPAVKKGKKSKSAQKDEENPTQSAEPTAVSE